MRKRNSYVLAALFAVVTLVAVGVTIFWNHSSHSYLQPRPAIVVPVTLPEQLPNNLGVQQAGVLDTEPGNYHVGKGDSDSEGRRLGRPGRERPVAPAPAVPAANRPQRPSRR
jgi:hypothetical protein